MTGAFDIRFDPAWVRLPSIACMTSQHFHVCATDRVCQWLEGAYEAGGRVVVFV